MPSLLCCLKAALVSERLLGFWFVALANLLQLYQKNATLAFGRLVGEDGFTRCLSVAFERLRLIIFLFFCKNIVRQCPMWLCAVAPLWAALNIGTQI
jgi:hypothetical protein